VTANIFAGTGTGYPVHPYQSVAAELSIKRVWPTVVPAQCRMMSLVCRNGRHLCPRLTQVDRLFLWQLLTPTYISQPNLLSTLMLTT